MQRVIAPGLPPWPPLLFDRRTRTAKVTARHATWRSYATGIQLTEVVVFGVRCGIACGVLMHFPSMEILFYFCIVGFIVYGLISRITDTLLRALLPGFLARQLFAKRSTVYFNPDAIVIQTDFYARPVAIWRKWQGQPVRGKFILQPDEKASSYQRSLDLKRQTADSHLAQAQMLSLVVTTTARDTTRQAAEQLQLLRSIPIMEIDGNDATKFTVVYAAAAALTSPKQVTAPQTPASGIDIDLA